MRRESDSTNPCHLFLPIACAAFIAVSGSGGLLVSQKRTNMAIVSTAMVWSRSMRAIRRSIYLADINDILFNKF